MIAWVIDNDILFKGTCYGILTPLIQAVGVPGNAGVLGQAKFVLPRKFQKKLPALEATEAIVRLGASMSVLQEIEPTQGEVELAAALEFEATSCRLEFDAGESILAAVVLLRCLSNIFTGDKRAIKALQVLIRDDVNGLSAIRLKTTCLEQGFQRMIQAGLATAVELRNTVCGKPSIDTALSICFSCASPEIAVSDEGLRSYVDSLRNSAPDVLAP